MLLIPDWKLILSKAWSVKFQVAATLLSALEVVVAIINPGDIPNGIFAGMAAAVTIMATIARVLAQKEITK